MNFNKLAELKNKSLAHVDKINKKVPFVQEFKDFLKEYKVIGVAVAFIMAAASTDLVKSLVNNIIMPIITPFIPGGAWQTATVKLGPVVLGLGAFVGSLINFLILACVVFIIAKIILKEEKVSKK